MGCGEVVVDGVVVPLDCWTKDYAKLQGASTAIARASFQGGAAVPDYIDHRRDKLEGPSRNQRSVGAGTAVALASAIDQALIANGTAASVSALQLWARAPRPNLGAIVSASMGKGIATEPTLPWDEALACKWAAPEAARLCKAGEKGKAPTLEEVGRAEQTPFARLDDVVELDGTNGDWLRDTLARKQDVVVVLRVDPDAWKSVVKTSDAEPLLPDYVGASAVQTVLLVGYAKQDGAWFFLLKNGWGDAWGREGYAWLTETTLKKNVIEAYVVHASLASSPAPGSVATTCPAGQVPDAVTKQCAPPCPDKSPRTNGVCADARVAGCAPGFVNTTGRCVPAAPDRSGSDPATGVSYVCGPAGCIYTWQKGTLGCQQQTCGISCPAPKYLAAINKTQKTVTCTE